MIYKGADPQDVMVKEEIYIVEKKENNYWLRIIVPFVDKKELELSQNGEELAFSIKNEHRRFILPHKLKGLEIESAKYENGKLNILFTGRQ